MRNWDSLVDQFVSIFSFSYNDRRLTEALQAIKRILLTTVQLMDGCIDLWTLEHIYESGYPEAMACGKVDKGLDEDDLEESKHFSFHKTGGERHIKDGPVTDAPHLLPLKFRKHIVAKGWMEEAYTTE